MSHGHHHGHHDWGVGSMLGALLGGMAVAGAAQMAGGQRGMFVGTFRIVPVLFGLFFMLMVAGALRDQPVSTTTQQDDRKPQRRVEVVGSPEWWVQKTPSAPIAAVPAAPAGDRGGEALALVLFVAAGVAVAAYTGVDLMLGARYWKTEIQMEKNDWRRHHIPVATRDEALIMAGRFLQAAPDATGYRVLSITARQDKKWFQREISDWSAARNVEQAVIELGNLAESQKRMKQIRDARKAPKSIRRM